MLDLIPDMFPTADDPGNIDRKFFEPAAGSGNFLEEILRRKTAHVSSRRYRSVQLYEHRLFFQGGHIDKLTRPALTVWT